MVHTLVTFHAHPDDEAIAVRRHDGARQGRRTPRRARRRDARRAGRDTRPACSPTARRSPTAGSPRRRAGGRDPRRRPRRVPRLPRLGHGRRADQRRARLLRGRRHRRGRAPAGTHPRRKSTPTCSPSTTTTAATAIPTTSRCTGSACAPPRSPARRGLRGDDEPRPLQAADGRATGGVGRHRRRRPADASRDRHARRRPKR